LFRAATFLNGNAHAGRIATVQIAITPDEVAQRAFPLPGEAEAPLRVIVLFQRGHWVPGEDSVLREQLGEMIPALERAK
jgi:hypothetical protein